MFRNSEFFFISALPFHLFVYGFSFVCVKQIRLCIFIFIVYIVRFLSFFLCEGERKVLNVYVSVHFVEFLPSLLYFYFFMIVFF